jgi:hypothetical protein
VQPLGTTIIKMFYLYFKTSLAKFSNTFNFDRIISIKINHFKYKELYIIVGFIMNLVISSNMIKHY